MSLDISAETEARLIRKAREQGLSIDNLLSLLLSEAPQPKSDGEVRELPRWNLGAKGSLSRKEFYNDVR